MQDQGQPRDLQNPVESQCRMMMMRGPSYGDNDAYDDDDNSMKYDGDDNNTKYDDDEIWR